jgi:hypothetical protein
VRCPSNTLGTQAEINTKYRAFGAGAGEDFCDLLRQPNKVLPIGHGGAGRFRAVPIDVEQIDIRTVIKLVAA